MRASHTWAAERLGDVSDVRCYIFEAKTFEEQDGSGPEAQVSVYVSSNKAIHRVSPNDDSASIHSVSLVS